MAVARGRGRTVVVVVKPREAVWGSSLQGGDAPPSLVA